MVGTQRGYGFVTTFKDLITRQHSGKQFVSVEKGDALLKPLALQADDAHLAMVSKRGRMLIVDLAELKVLSGGGRGTILMGLDAPDVLARWVAFGPAGLVASGVYRNRATEMVLGLVELADYVGKRARKGRAVALKIKQPAFRRA